MRRIIEHILFLSIFLPLLFSCGSEINVKIKSDRAQELGGNLSGGANNQISLSNLVVSNIENNSFNVAVNFIGDENTNSVTTLYMCNETTAPGCLADIVGTNYSMSGLSSFKNLSVGPLNPIQYNPGDRVNLVVVTTDTDGVVVGARLSLSFNLSSAIPIYRSFGYLNTAALATGTGNGLTISGGRASFASALGDTIGLGDALQFDSDNNGSIDAVLFIHLREDSQNYQVRTTDGSIPADLTIPDEDWSIFRAYTDLTDMENGDENVGLDDAIEDFDLWSGGKDLVSANQQWNMVLYADAVVIGAVNIIIDGWTTDTQRKIKMFTPSLTSEVGVSQRHVGIWDETKFTIKGSGAGVIQLYEDIDFEGIQIFNSNDLTSNQNVLRVGAEDITVVLKNNIVRAHHDGGASDLDSNIIINGGGTSNRKIFMINNIIQRGTTGVYQGSGFASQMYFYNNTFAGQSRTGIHMRCGNGAVCKIVNNLIATRGTDIFLDGGSFAFSASNSTSDATSPDGTAFQNKTIIFNEPVVYDYRIAGHSYSAIGTGTDLSADTDYAFNDDIRGTTRTRWDIGANTAANMLFRSIGIGNTTTLQAGIGNDLNISVNSEGHTQANFANLVAFNIGVGDVIQYDADGVGGVDTLAFISQRLDTQNFIVKDVNGDNAVVTTAASQSWDIFRAYDGVNAAFNASENAGINGALRNFETSTKDLVTNNQQLYYPLYAEGVDNSVGSLSGITSSNFNHIKFYAPKESYEVGLNQRHRGVFNTNFASTGSRLVFDNAIIIEGMQMTRAGVDPTSGNQYVLQVSANQGRNVVLKENIFVHTELPGGGGNDAAVRLATSDQNSTIYMLSNLIINGPIGIAADSNFDAKAFIHHNTIMDAYGSGTSINCNTIDSCDYRNNIIRATGSDVQVLGAAMTTHNNITYDGTSPDGAGFQNQTVVFVNEATDDFRLDTTDTTAAGNAYKLATGDDKFVLNNLDLLGSERTTDDIGAFVYVNFGALVSFSALGSGLPGDPFQIFTRQQFEDYATNPTLGCNATTAVGCGHSLAIIQDIDFTTTTFTAIGTAANAYRGEFDCNGNTLSNLSLGSGSEDDLGLFAVANNQAVFRNCTLDNFNMNGRDDVGALLGDGDNVDASNIVVTNTVISGRNDVGGLIGSLSSANSDVIGVSADATVTGNGFVGGLIGRAFSIGSFTTSVSTAAVSGDNAVGGLIGRVDLISTFINNYATGDIVCTTAGATSNCGGAVGSLARTSVVNCFATGTVRADKSNIGGFVGETDGGGLSPTFLNSYAMGDVIGGSASNDVGGFVGDTFTNNINFNECWASGDVKSSGGNVGGFAGLSYTNYNHSFALGKVEIDIFGTGNNVGGFIGHHANGNINNCFAQGDVTNTSVAANSNVGGLVGRINSDDSIAKSYAYGNVYAGTANSGGFVGLLDGDTTLTDNFATGNVYAVSDYAGGFIGYFDSTATGASINRSYASGNVTGDNDVGGFVGYAGGDISNSYATGDVRGTNVAGFVGEIDGGALNNNYSLSPTLATTNDYAFVHTITSGTMLNNYFNFNINAADGGPLGITSAPSYDTFSDAQFRDAANFDSGQSGNWDFVNDWTQLDERDYPIHKTSVEGQCVDNASATTYDAVGGGTKSSPYLICNRTQWEDLATRGCHSGSNADCDKAYEVGADIDFAKSFPIVASVSNNFTGFFNGRKKTLKNLDINSGIGRVGLFRILNGTAVNLNVESGKMVTTAGRTGFIAGDTEYGFVLNSKASGEIDATSFYAGGLVGGIADSSVFSHLEFAGDMDVDSYHNGGIIGNAIENLYARDLVAYTNINNPSDGVCGGLAGFVGGRFHKTKTFGSIICDDQNGGLVGNNSTSDTIVSQSYSHMDVTATSGLYNGGLFGTGSNVGRRSDLIDSYSRYSTINAGTFDYAGGLSGIRVSIFNSYADNTVLGTGSFVGGLAGSSGNGLANFWNSSNGIVDGRALGGAGGSENGLFEALTNTTIDDLAEYNAEGWDFTHTWVMADNVRAPRLRWDLHPWCQVNSDAVTYDRIGTGTLDNPHIICFKEQLIDLSVNGCDSDSSAGCGLNYLIANDIDLKGETFLGIGGGANYFTGEMDGQGYTISNITISRAGIDFIGGIFNQVQGAQLRNINLTLMDVTARDSVGLFVGYADSNTVISNVHAQGVLTGQNDVGGLIGSTANFVEVRGSSAYIDITSTGYSVGGLIGYMDASGLLENVRASGQINASGGLSDVGGLVGHLWSNTYNSWASVDILAPTVDNIGGFVGNLSNAAVVSFSSSSGTVSGNNNVGGFVGRADVSTISNSYSKVTSVNAAGNNAGGFVGQVTQASTNISLSYAAATTVSAFANAHGFIGLESAASTMTNNYWDNTLVASANDVGRYEGLATADMDDNTNFTGWNNTTIWRFPTNNYPELILINK